MTEKEKMLKGELYYSSDESLVQERALCKQYIFEYNNIHPLDKEKRQEILYKILGKIGDNVYIKSPFYCDYGKNIEIGNDFYANINCTILDCANVIIGNNVFFGPNVSLFTAGHPIDFKVRNTGLEFAKPITIGNNVWIGGNTVVNPGITIGNNVVIGAGSIITKNIPDNTMAFGNPCKIHKKIDN